MTMQQATSAYAKLANDLAAAIAAAAKSGMSQDDIKAALEQITALVENSDEE